MCFKKTTGNVSGQHSACNSSCAGHAKLNLAMLGADQQCLVGLQALTAEAEAQSRDKTRAIRKMHRVRFGAHCIASRPARLFAFSNFAQELTASRGFFVSRGVWGGGGAHLQRKKPGQITQHHKLVKIPENCCMAAATAAMCKGLPSY